jgi:hypothetical protein
MENCSRAERLPLVDCLWSYGAIPLLCFESDRLSLFVRDYSCNKYIILLHWLFCIHFLYGMCVKLIPGHTYYKHSIWL